MKYKYAGVVVLYNPDDNVKKNIETSHPSRDNDISYCHFVEAVKLKCF